MMSAFSPAILSKIRIPSENDKVYKDECAYSFDSPVSETGLYICMNTFYGIGKEFLELHYRKTLSSVYLHMRRIKKKILKTDDEPPKEKPTKLAIGVKGGFCVNEKNYVYEDHNTIVILPDWTELALDSPEVPDMVQTCAAMILAADSAAKVEENAALQGTWEGENRRISKHTENLVQLSNGVKIPPKGWKCSMCNKTDNLWLNLTDGTILCGRKFWDGSGGNNHAVDHFNSTGYPLAVKLGTITGEGADVYSYDEDDMVEDPHLGKHLTHFGINIALLEKTEKTMIELEIDLNEKVGEWDVIQEAGSKLEPVYGPGYTGIHNLGNSCYLNSVMQVLFSLPDFQKIYVEPAQSIFTNSRSDTIYDFDTQMVKLGVGLCSGKYSKPPVEAKVGEPIHDELGIHPRMFKTMIGRGNAEFSTKRQQDAQEFLLHIINLIERNSRGKKNPCDSFRFKVEERIQCSQSSKVKYTYKDDFILAVPIPLEATLNKDEVRAHEKQMAEQNASGGKASGVVRPRINLSSCIEAFSATEIVEDFYSMALNAKTTAQKTTRLASFPDYLFIQLKKFTIGDDWVPRKLDVSIDISNTLDINQLRGKGLQPGEEKLPESNDQEVAVQMDQAVISQLVEMGFPAEACKKAVYSTKNEGVDQAMDWLMQHMDDPDFAAPFEVVKQEFVPNAEAVAILSSMGFTPDQAKMALKATGNNLERAADWIFSHASELGQPMEFEATAVEGSEVNAENQQYRDGNGQYSLVAFISHMGTSTMVGHYVCHILKDGQWVIYNDEKVALSEHPPNDLGYIYLYRRKDLC